MANLNDYSTGSQQAGYAANAPKPANAFDNLSSAVSDLRDMQKMAQALADRLTGNAAPSVQDSSMLKEIGGGGLIDGVERQASAIREIQNSIYANLSRIENRL